MQQHTAQIEKSSHEDKPVLKGEFEVIDGNLSFTCHTKNIEFDVVRDGLVKLRDELNRQIFQEKLCPFYKAHGEAAEIDPQPTHPPRQSAMDNFNAFWRDLVTTDGALDEQKIANELSDYSHIMEQASAVYCYVSGLSKVMYWAGAINDSADEQYSRLNIERAKDFVSWLYENKIIRQRPGFEKAMAEIEKYF